MTDKDKTLNAYKEFRYYVIDILEVKINFYSQLIDNTADDDVKAIYCGIYDELVEVYQLVKSEVKELNLWQ